MKKIIYCILIILLVTTSIILVKKNYHKPVIRIKQINQLGKAGKIGKALRNALEKRYRIVMNDSNYDIIVDDVFGNIDIKTIDTKDAIKLFYTSEASSPNLNNYDLVIGFDHINDPKYIRYPCYYTWWGTDGLKTAKKPRFNQGKCNPNKKYFACFLVSNGSHDFIGYNGKIMEGTKARDSMFHKLSEYKFVASGGPHLNNVATVVPRGKKSTQEWLEQCKFVIAYENQYHNGYITEKVFQAYFAGAVPIYWGDKTAVSDINKDAVIYADDFTSEEDIAEYVKKIDNDDELYCQIWNRHLITSTKIDYEALQEKVTNKLFELIDNKFKDSSVGQD